MQRVVEQFTEIEAIQGSKIRIAAGEELQILGLDNWPNSAYLDISRLKVVVTD